MVVRKKLFCDLFGRIGAGMIRRSDAFFDYTAMRNTTNPLMF
jgi:hypothetical protein